MKYKSSYSPQAIVAISFILNIDHEEQLQLAGKSIHDDDDYESSE